MITPKDLTTGRVAAARSWFTGFFGWLIKMLGRASPRNLLREMMARFDFEFGKIEEYDRVGFKRKVIIFRVKSEFHNKKKATALEVEGPDTGDDNRHDGSS